MYFGLMIIGGIFTLIGMVVSNRLKSVFKKHSRTRLRNGMSGAEIADAMLKHYGIYDVRIVRGQGFLSDHYNPRTKTVSLSPDVYDGRSVSAAAVAAHECGHAVQHDTAYGALQMRSAIVPAVQLATTAQQYLMMFALAMAGGGLGDTLLFITIIAFLVTTLFSLITLPVEFDASRRALAWLDSSNTTTSSEQSGAKEALWWAAMTYVSAALAALAQLVYLIIMYMNRTSND